MTMLKGARFALFVGAIIGTIGLALYPIVIKPIMNPEEYKQARKAHSLEARKH